MANLSTYRLEFVVCKSTGEPVEAEQRAALRKIERRRNIATVATIAFRLEDRVAAQISPGTSRLKVYRSPSAAELALNPAASKQLVFYGSLPADGVSEETDSGMMTLSFQDPRWVLRSRFLTAPASFAATDQATILASIISTQNGRQALWFTTSGTTGVLRDRNYDAGKNVSDLIDEMTKVTNGCDLDFTPLDGYITASRSMGNLFFTTRQGSDKSSVVFLYQQTSTGPGGGGNITKVSSTYAPIFNSATQQGTDPTGVANTQTYSVTSGFDLLEVYETASDAFTSGALLEKASGVVAENYSLRRIVSVGDTTWDAPMPFTDYDLGDTVRLTVKRGSLQVSNASMRVDGYDLIADQEGNCRANPILTSIP